MDRDAPVTARRWPAPVRARPGSSIGDRACARPMNSRCRARSRRAGRDNRTPRSAWRPALDKFVIHGGSRLCGRLTVKGSKNAALPIMAAALLTDQPVVLQDVAQLADITNMQGLLRELGCRVELMQPKVGVGQGDQSPGQMLRLQVED